MKTVMTTFLMVILLGAPGFAGQENPTPHVDIHIAALYGNIDEIRKHIAAGSDLDEKDDYGSTPLIVAITFDKANVAQALIEAGADMTIANTEGSTPLHIAAFLCRTEIVEALLENGADKTVKNFAGRTALETVAGSFDDVKSVYESIETALLPFGFNLDYERIQAARPKIAEMLR